MRKIRILSSLFCFFACFLVFPGHAFSVLKLNTIVDGEVAKKGLKIYTFSGVEYFSVREVAEVYNGKLSWHPITGKVAMTMNNRKLDIYFKSSKVVIGEKKILLKAPNIKKSSKVYIMKDFIFSPEFSKYSETNSLFNPDTNILTIEKLTKVQSPRFYSGPDDTEIVIEFDEGVKYMWDDSKKGKIEISFPNGWLSREKLGVNDGVVREIDLQNTGIKGVVAIFLTEGAGKIKRNFIEKPRSLEIKIERTELAGKYEPKVPELASAPKALTGLVCPPGENAMAVGLETSPETDSVSAIEKDVSPEDSAIAEEPVKSVFSKTSIVKKDPLKKKLIVLDAGHGGKDPGAIGPNGTQEKDINLKIVYELKDIFEKDNNFDVVLTRTDDTFIPLVERTDMANKQGADLFISIHCNASIKPKSNGFEIFFLSERASDASAKAAEVLENSVIRLEGKPSKKRKKLQELLWSMAVNEFINESSEVCCFVTTEVTKRIKIENRGVKQAGFYVLRGAEMPAILVECAFISNLGEEAKLRSKRFQEKIADSVYDGIQKYNTQKGL